MVGRSGRVTEVQFVGTTSEYSRLRCDLRSNECDDLFGGEPSVSEAGEDMVDSVEWLRDKQVG